MPVAISPTEDAVITALRAWLLMVVPAGCDVIQGQINRVAEPAGENFVMMTPIGEQQRLSTNADAYEETDDGQLRSVWAVFQMGVQLDIHGPDSASTAAAVALLWRDTHAIDACAPVFAPLFHSPAHQMPFINGEAQYENRTVLTLYMEVDPVAILAQQSATAVVVGLIEVDERYPPT